jgi:hypothetical protein
MPEESCEQCGYSAGIGIAFNIARGAGVNVDDLLKDFTDKKITVKETIEKVKERLSDDFDKSLVDEVESLMLEEQKPQSIDKKEEKPQCVSLIAKMGMAKQIGEWMERDLPEEVKENLKRSKEAIDNMPTCEAE